METAGNKGKTRGQSQTSRRRNDRQAAHFQTVRSGGFEETQIICYLWDLVKSMEAVEEAGYVKTMEAVDAQDLVNTMKPMEASGTAESGLELLSSLKKQIHRRIRVEMRRYFLRRKRRNVILAIGGTITVIFLAGLFSFLIGIDRVSGESMYPYLNHGDWIVYSRLDKKFLRDEVVVFARKGENYVKRVAGLPGDRVEISASGSRVVINGTQMRESYVTLTNPAAGIDSGGEGDPMGEPLTIMDGQYLVLGDNRSISIDSRNRDVGTVPEDEILGRVVLVLRIKG